MMVFRTADRVSDTVAILRKECGMPVNPGRRGPVLLDRFFQSANLTHAARADLSTATVVNYLVAERYVSGPHVLADVPATADRIDGFLFWAGSDGVAFVNADRASPLPRRRFTAAHELGHAILHQGQMGRFRVDVKINDAAEDADELEREANRFAAELLMPAEVIRSRAEAMRREFGCCPRGVLAYQVAAELLVSREAMRYRLADLEVGDE
jgi:hypothetical protein